MVLRVVQGVGESDTPGKECQIVLIYLLTPMLILLIFILWGGNGPNQNGRKQNDNQAKKSI